MLRVGLTGGLASGKSVAADVLRDLGAVVFDADAVVRDLYAPGGEGASVARELFGETVLDREGGVDRQRLAAIIFADPDKRRDLEARIHPLVRREILRRSVEAEKAGTAVAVVEASQLLEAREESNFDRVLLIVAPDEERARRWEQKGGSAEDARRRIRAQISPSAAVGRVTDVIINDGTLEDLERKVKEVWRKWLGA